MGKCYTTYYNLFSSKIACLRSSSICLHYFLLRDSLLRLLLNQHQSLLFLASVLRRVCYFPA